MKLKNGLIAGILVAGAASYLSFTPINNVNSGISLSNIEALSSGETGEKCFGTGSVDCPTSSTKAQLVLYS